MLDEKVLKNVALKTQAAILPALSPIGSAKENEDTVTQRQTIRGLMGAPASLLIEQGQVTECVPCA
jgi:hypothetical protein